MDEVLWTEPRTLEGGRGSAVRIEKVLNTHAAVGGIARRERCDAAADALDAHRR